MPRNSSGTYSLPAGNPVVSNTLIETSWANPTMSDIGTSLTDSLDRFGRGSMLAPLKITDGTVGAPGLSFSGEASTGIYRTTAGTLNLAISGVLAAAITSSAFTFATGVAPTWAADPASANQLVRKSYADSLVATGPYLPLAGGTMTGAILGAAGLVGAPGYAFAGDSNTGIYSPGADTISVTTGGTQRLTFDSNGITPGATNTYNTGASGVRWANVFSVAGNFSGLLSGVDISTTGATILGNAVGDTLNVAAGSLQVGATGLVGLNGAAVGSRLEVNTGSSALNGVNARFNAGNAAISFAVASSTGFAYITNNSKPVVGADTQTYDTNTFATQLRMDSGAFVFNRAVSGAAGNPITWIEAGRFDSSGNLLPGANNTQTLGSGALQWSDVRTVNLTTTGNTILGDAVGDTLNAANNSLVISSGGNVGVNAASPSRRLTINEVGSSFLAYQRSNSEKWVVGCDASNQYSIFDSTAGATRTIIDASGNYVPAANNAQTNGSAALRWSAVNSVLGDFSGTVTTSFAGAGFTHISSASGVLLQSLISNTSNTANSNARDSILVAGASAGDAYTFWSVNGVTDWSAGVDNSDSDSWVLANSSALGTNNRLRINPAGDITPGADATQLLGSPTLRFSIIYGNSVEANSYASPSATSIVFKPAGGVDRLTLTTDGRLYGSALHNNAGSVTGTTNQYIASGTYTPTITSVTNVTSTASSLCKYTRVGNVVTVIGSVTIQPTAAGATTTNVGISLPIASNLTGLDDVGGSGGSLTANTAAHINADTVNDRATFSFLANTTSTTTWRFIFGYEVL